MPLDIQQLKLQRAAGWELLLQSHGLSKMGGYPEYSLQRRLAAR